MNDASYFNAILGSTKESGIVPDAMNRILNGDPSVFMLAMWITPTKACMRQRRLSFVNAIDRLPVATSSNSTTAWNGRQLAATWVILEADHQSNGDQRPIR
jgi:hypothetical protein